VTAPKPRAELLRRRHDDATEKQCRVCRKWKPRKNGFYSRSCAPDGLQTICKACDNARSSKRAEYPEGDRPSACKRGKFCNECGGLPHRVEGKRCRRCGLAFADEAPPELELRRFDDIRTRC